MIICDKNSAGLLAGLVDSEGFENDSDWSFEHFKEVIRQFLSRDEMHRVCEIGGGRNPMFSLEEIQALGVDYTVLDISQEELDWLNDGYNTLCCSIEETDREPEFDFMFSTMVMEHVKSAKSAYENIHDKLKPGGICLSYHPTLYAVPFVVNLLLPERLSEWALYKLTRGDRYPGTKFPAYYSWCKASPKTVKKIRTTGFSQAALIPFYGHTYYRHVPVARSVERWFRGFAKRRQLTTFAAFAYTLVKR